MIKEYAGTLYGNFRQNKFTDVYNSAEHFITDYNNVGIPATISNDEATTLYYLLYASYGNSVIASSDTTRFKYKMFSIIWQYGPTWSKEVEIQKKLRELSDDEITKGSIQIYNTADNPSVDPSTNTEEFLKFVKNQNVAKNQKGKLEAYALLDSLLKRDVTQDFLNRFKSLFLVVVEPEDLLLYENIGE